MTTEIKLIENKTEQYFKVTVNGNDEYTPFKYSTFDEGEEMRTLAKACAFDEVCNAQMKGKVIVSYLTL